MPRRRLTNKEREVSQARRRQLDAARKRRRRMDASYRLIEQQANTEARRKARKISRTLCRYDVRVTKYFTHIGNDQNISQALQMLLHFFLYFT
jgi:hypothetical protein